MPLHFQDYYKILGLKKSATPSQIKTAYRTLARKYHPDVSKHSEAEARLKQINEAYAVLRDPEKRSRYDKLERNWEKGTPFQPPPRPQPSAAGQQKRQEPPTGKYQSGGGDFSDFFKRFFSGMHEGEKHSWQDFENTAEDIKKQADSEADIEISLEDAFFGANRTIELETMTPQPDGSLARSFKKYQVSIPKGVREGSRIRLAGQGNATFGRRHGDLYLKVHIKPNDRFQIENHNLVETIDITPWEAALGAEISIPTMDGSVRVRIPPGAQSMQRLRIRGKGLPRPGRQQDGDLLVRLRIVVPKNLSSREEKLFRQLMKESPFHPRGHSGDKKG
ncbi:MAG: DnaJ C-terminal domain-containing protein [Candidatus Sumerlaeia bacterium]